MLVLLAGALVCYVLIVTVLFLAQRRLLFRPDRSPPDLTRVAVPGLRPLTVTTADGLMLLAWFMPPARDGAPVVLYLHGNAGNIGHRGYRLAPMRAFGWGVLLLEYRGFGGNPGGPSETGLVADARAGLDALRAMGLPPSDILVWGESLGSGVAVRLAAEQSVAAVLLESPFTSIAAIARSRYPFVPVRWLLRDRFDSLSVVGRLTAPVLVMHGARDGIVPVAMGRAIYAAAPDPKQLWIAPNGGHVDLVEAGAIQAAADFVERLDREITGADTGAAVPLSNTWHRSAADTE